MKTSLITTFKAIIFITFISCCNLLIANTSSHTSNNTKIDNSPFMPYELNYILPFNYSDSNRKYDEIFPNMPNRRYEVKFQISAQTPIVSNIFGKPLSLNVFYTQLSFWQFYAKSAYFRESNYNPGLFFHLQPSQAHLKIYSIDLGAMHQSNGRGSTFERSWNRVFMNFTFLLSPKWSFTLRPWVRVHILEAKDYNPQITHFLGYGDMRLTYHHNNFMASLMVRNLLESHLKRGAGELDISFPFYHYFHGFVQGFTGYGESLISYNHYTNSVGVGISLFSKHTPSD